MRITQGTFSFLPDFTDEEIAKQIQYALRNEWAIMIEYTDDPHPRNYLWEMWDQPMFDLTEDDVEPAMEEIRACRDAYPYGYVKVVCYDRSLGRQTSRLSFIVGRPEDEPGFHPHRQEKADRQIRYTLHSYATEQPYQRRYGATGHRDDVAGDADGKQSQSNGKQGE